MATLPNPHTWAAGDDATSGNLQTLTDALNFLIAPPRARVYQTVAQAIATATETAITFGSEDVDTDGIHSTVTNTSRFTAVTAGRYRFTGGCGIIGNATGVRTLRLRKNGAASATAAVRQAGNATNTFLQITEEILLAAGDYVELTMDQNSGVSLNTTATSDTCYLHGVWVSTT